MGFISGSQFNLVVSLRYTPGPDEMPFWCELFEQTSRILHDATDGALSIGQVLFSINSMGGKDADVWIHPNSDVWSNSTGARLWFPFESLDVPQDHMFYPTILAHELSHYLFDVRDEYNNGSVCIGDVTTQASMMEGYGWANYTRWTDAAGNDFPDWVTFFPEFDAGTAVLQLGNPSEFCHDGNHDPNADHNQNNINGGQSCWTYMANDANHNDLPYGLVAPGAGGPATAAPALPPAVVCTELIPVQRFMLVLDSGAKGDPNEPNTYTARVPTRREQPGQYLVFVDAVRARGKFTLELDELYRQRPKLDPKQQKRVVDIPAVRRRAMVAVVVDREGRSQNDPLVGHNPKRPWIPKNHAAWLKRWRKKAGRRPAGKVTGRRPSRTRRL